MNYSNFNLKTNTDTTIISVLPGMDINVKNYLPIEDKNDLIQIALQHSEEAGIYNLLKTDMYFELYMIYLYTDIEFTDEEKADELKLYNELKSSGIIDAVKRNMNESEMEYLTTRYQETIKMKIEYRQTLAAVLTSFVENLPINAAGAMDIINKFNPEDFQRVIEFATAANGGRPIK